jgi:transposase InsO family protein
MDFITQLPLTANKYDAIVVFVDRLTKMVHVAPTSTTVTAEGTAILFWECVFKHHGLPKTIVSDRGPVFTSNFMRGLMKKMDTKQSLSTAWHPQSDGQTERMNRVLEDMIRHYVGALRHGEWDTCLVAAEFAINNSYQESVRNTPFYLNYGRHPRVPLGSLKQPSHNFSAAALADRWETGLVEAKRCLQSAQQRQKTYYDAGHRDVSFNEGEEVLLSTRNLHLRRAGDKSSTPKLLPKWVGPFKILEVIGKGAYRLQLPDTMKIHPVFHVSLLKTFRSNGSVQPPDPIIIDGEEEFELERILDHRFVKRGRKVCPEYLVKWRHFGTEHNSWEPDRTLNNTVAYEAYWTYVGLAPPVHTPV